MHLKLRKLVVFQAVMETGSVSKAAERLGLSQPAVSIALTRLEEVLGYALFNRSKGHFVPKPEAMLLQADAELAIMSFERFASHAELIGRGAEGLVRVASIGSAGINLLPQVIATFAEQRPQVEVELQVRSSPQISYLVGNNQTDIGVVEGPVSTHALAEAKFSIPCVCILRKDDPLAAQDVLRPEDLAEQRLISVFKDHPLDRQIRGAYEEAGVPWTSQIRCYFFSIMRNLVAKGAGVAIVDAINGCAEANDDVVWRRFEPEVAYPLSVIRQSDASLQKPAMAFLEMTIQALEDIDARVRP